MMAIAATEEGGGHRLMHRQASAPDGLTLALRQLRSQGVWVVWQRRLLPAASELCFASFRIAPSRAALWGELGDGECPSLATGRPASHGPRGAPATSPPDLR